MAVITGRNPSKVNTVIAQQQRERFYFGLRKGGSVDARSLRFNNSPAIGHSHSGRFRMRPAPCSGALRASGTFQPLPETARGDPETGSTGSPCRIFRR